MILRSISVQGWRCFADRVRIGPLTDRINIIHGPNGIGKSTLFHALVRGFIDAHRVTGREAETVRPWGRALAPTITLEFEQGGVGYRLTKRFLDHPAAELERLEGGRFTRLAEGDAADERARQLLRASAPGKGLSQGKHWGMAQVLWTPQGDISLTELSGDLPSDIRAALGAQVTGPEGSRLEQAIEDVFGQYYTPGGMIKKGQSAPEVVRLEETLSGVRERLTAARQKLQDYEEAARRLENARMAQVQLRLEADATAKAVAEARTRAQAYGSLRNQHNQQTERVKACAAQAREIKHRVDEIGSVATDLAEAQASQRSLAKQLPTWRESLADAQRSSSGRKAELETCKAKQSVVDEARREADLADKHSSARRNAEALRDRHQRICTAEDELEKARVDRSSLVAPDATTLRSIRKATRDRDEARIRLNAAMIRLEIVPESDGSATVVAGESIGRQRLLSKQAVVFQGTPEVVIDLEHVGRLRASGPEMDVEADRKQHNRAVQRLEAHSAAFGTTDIEKLEALHESAKELDAAVDKTQGHLDGLLGGDTRDTVQAELAQAEAVLTWIGEQKPAWVETPPDTAALAAAAAEYERQHRQEVRTAESAWEAAERTKKAAENKVIELTATLRETAKRVESDRTHLALLTNDGKTDDARRTELETALLALVACRTDFVSMA